MPRRPEAIRTRRLARPWRWLFIFYALALTTGTHWPHLDLTGDKVPPPDKFLHVMAFGGLTLLLWRTRWIANPLFVALIALGWCVVDEVTQALPGLGREISAQDVMASMIGVSLVGAGLWAARPVGGPPNRLRRDLLDASLDEVFTTPWSWAALIGSFLGGATAALLIVFVGWRLLHWTPRTLVRLGFLLIVGGGFSSAWLALAALWRTSLREMIERRRCFQCGLACEAMEDESFDAQGTTRCPRCAATLRLGQWLHPPKLPQRTTRRAASVPALAAMGLLAVVLGVLYLAAVKPGSLPLLGRVDRLWSSLAEGMDLLIDLALPALGMLIAVRWYRQRLAPVYDRQGAICPTCNHDLSQTPVTRGIGRCGECGTPFMRLNDPLEAAMNSNTPA